jgi:molybdate transport system substrate-binding protein
LADEVYLYIIHIMTVFREVVRRARSVAIAALGLALAACSASTTPGGSPTPGETAPPSRPSPAVSVPATANGDAPPASLSIYAAASLKVAMAEVKVAYETANHGTTLTFSTDSSAALETKIEQGAPADVFLSADTTNPRKLSGAGLTAGGVVTFAGNVLTVIVPAANPAGITSPADLARSGVKVIAAGDNVPIQRYAIQLVANLAKQPGYPANFAAAYAANVKSKEDNVAAIVAKVELGEGDAGIVYATDARASTTVTAIAVPAAANVLATYGGVVVRSSSNQSAAAAFLAWLTSPAGQSILARFGFQPLTGS